MEKVTIPLSLASRLINHGPCIIVSVGDSINDNLFTVAWNMPVRKDPPLVAIESGKSHHSYPLIAKTGEFGINVPNASIAEAVMAVGTVSGAKVEDKWIHAGLTRQDATKIKAPLVQEAVATLECRVCQVVDLGASSLLIAQVVAAMADKKSFENGVWKFDNGLELLHHLGGNKFSVAKTLIEIS